MNKFIVVAGVSKSHLLRTMKLLNDAKFLEIGITSFVPKNQRWIQLVPRRLQFRLRSRLESIHDVPWQSSIWPEIVYQVGRILHRRNLGFFSDYFLSISFIMYSKLADRVIQNFNNLDSYSLLVRAGFCKKIQKGNHFLIIDASLAHPQTLPSLMATGEFGLSSIDSLSRIDKLIIEDLSKADLILVNSDFVRDSYVFAGVDEQKIVVGYLPPLPIFRESVNFMNNQNSALQILFAGGLEERKGIELVREVADLLTVANFDFHLKLIGNWGRVHQEVKLSLQSNSNVTIVPWMRERELASEMAKCDIFLFPSYAEGGARVVTEAMALGKVVVTSRNSGSPVTHGHDGIISPLESKTLVDWIMELRRNTELKSILEMNALQTVRTKLSDSDYLNILLQINR